MRIRIISIALLLAAGVATPDSGTTAEEAKQAETAAPEQAKDEPEAQTASSPVEQPIMIAAMPAHATLIKYVRESFALRVSSLSAKGNRTSITPGSIRPSV